VAKAKFKLNISPRAVPVYKRAYQENWDAKRLIKELKALPGGI